MRARSSGPGAEALARSRAIWLAHIVGSTEERTPERGAAVQRMMDATGLRKSRCYELIRDYEQQGIAAVERSRRGDAGTVRCDEAIRDAWIDWATDPRWADRPVTVRAAAYRRQWAATHGGDITDIPSDTTLRRWLQRSDKALTMTPKERKNARRRRLSITAAYANHVWQADQRQADFEVVDRTVNRATGEVTVRRFRPLLFSFVDVYSGAVMGGGYYEGRHTAYGTQIVEAALLDAIYLDPDGLPLCGVPEHIYWDNGAPHRSRWMERLAKSLGIELVNSIPGEPQAHGLIEGWHRILKDRFESGLPGYVGGDNQKGNRPLQMRLWDEGAAPEPDWLTLEEANRRWRGWLPELHEAPYAGGNPERGPTTPRYGRWSASAIEHPERRRVPRPEDLCWRLMHIADRTRRVVDGSVQFCNVTYTAATLGAWSGIDLYVHYLPSAPQRIWLVDETGELVCVAEPLDKRIFRSFEGHVDLKLALAEVRETRKLDQERAAALAAGAAEGRVDAGAAEAAQRAAERAVAPLEEAIQVRAERDREAARREADGNVHYLPLPGVAPAELRPERAPAAAEDPLFDDALNIAASAAAAARGGGDLFE